MRYRPEVDGLRALAVLPVIFFHAGLDGFEGGYVGVDVFFVISGFLITSIIISDMENSRFSILRFYERRARRILPALFLVTITCVPFALVVLLPADREEFGASMVAVALFVSNIFFWKHTDYFGTAAELQPLLHTWSLAVEEQYYLLFPLLLLCIWRCARHFAMPLMLCFAFGSLMLAQWGAYRYPEAGFFLLPTRGWELAIGAMLALRPVGFLAWAKRPLLREAVAFMGIAAIAYSVTSFNESTPFPSVYTLLPTLGTAAVLLWASSDTWVGRLLAVRPLVLIGLVSYSAYLWHQPVFALVRRWYPFEPPASTMLLLGLLSLALAFLTWRYVEAPFRDSKRVSRAGIWMMMVLGTLALVSVGMSLKVTRGFEASFVAGLDPEVGIAYELITAQRDQRVIERMFDDHACRFWMPAVDQVARSRFAACAERLGSAMVVLGDSHALNIYNSVAKSGVREFVVGMARPGCRPGGESHRCHYGWVAEFLQENRQHVSLVVYHQSGSYLFVDEKGRPDSMDAFKPGIPFALAET